MHARPILPLTLAILLHASTAAATTGPARPRVQDAIAYWIDDIDAQGELWAEADQTKWDEDDGADGPFSDTEEFATLDEVVRPSTITQAGLRFWQQWSAPSEFEDAPGPLAFGALARIHDTLQGAWTRWFDEPFYAVRLSSRYGKRFHPILKRWRLHNGIDLAARRGTPVRAF